MKHEAEAEAMVLPLELVEKILVWLPVKSLIRFRCVSKQWLSLISDSRFAILHYDTADAAPTNKNTRLLYLSSEVPEARCVDLEASIHGDYALQLPLSCRHFCLSILGSCRGFILLRIHVHGAPLLLWNPVTGSHRSVPYPVADPDVPCWGGLGYDESCDDYLVVVGWGGIGHKWKPQWEYFSVRTNFWKEIECGHLPPHLVTVDCALFCNGVLYWLAVKDMEVNFVIVAFDLAGKHLSMVSFPTSGGSRRLLKLFAGCLGISYLNFTEDQKTEIWVMKELSWTRLNVVLPYAHVIHPLCFTKGELVGTKNNELVKVSDKGVSVKSLRISCRDRDNDSKMVMFTESLLSLPDEFGGTGEEQRK
ncbi:F-box/kelch-repeat protein At3g23880-like [Arachis stenosperma]|uniref:F-box/kelch-repeat protein At3g23880-like n=1 Tax=Arachis stenosperma TaxID=217475 RepID=UPI0025AD563B|nr:F-box/kelch-repeat protein At3g23880-like [Arachis stenosperma]